MTTIDRVELNGTVETTAPKTRKPRKVAVKKTPARKSAVKKLAPVAIVAPPAPVATHRIKTVATVTMGILLPLLSLGTSHVAGNLARSGHYALAVFAVALMGCVLVVSLSHLAWAIGDVTRSARWACWALAVAFDLLLVMGETCHVTAASAGVGGVATAIMTVVCGVSMFLNVWAFLHHQQ